MLYQLYVTRISKRLHVIIALYPVYINIIKLVNAEIAKTQPRTGAFARSRGSGKVIPFPEPRDRANVLETRLAKTVFYSALHGTKP